jgi:AraC-like DNA-binding protein
MSKLICQNRCLSCIHYDNDNKPAIEIKQVEIGDSWQTILQAHKIIIAINGRFLFSQTKNSSDRFQSGQMLLLSAGIDTLFQSESSGNELLIIRLPDKVSFCENLRLEHLWQEADLHSKMRENTIIPSKPFLLTTNRMVEVYLSALVEHYRLGLRCNHYNAGKIRELFHILGKSYSKEELHNFFQPLLSSDTVFSQQVMERYASCRNITELAKAMNYSISGFEKRFKKVFNDAPYRWMMRKRAYEIYLHIETGEMNFKQISEKFGFSSSSVMNDFVKQMFGKTPGQIRKGVNKE